MAGPDLTSGRLAVENLMDDTCVVYPPSEPRDWVLNPATLRLEPPPDAPLYGTEAEPAMFKVKADHGVARDVVEGGVALAETRYRADFPVSAPAFPEGAVVVLKSSRRMPQAVGTLFVLGSLMVKTMAVQSSYPAERRERTEGS